MKYAVLLGALLMSTGSALAEEAIPGLTDRLQMACPSASHVQVGDSAIMYRIDSMADKSETEICLLIAYEDVKQNPLPVNQEGVTASTGFYIKENGTIVVH